MYVVSSNNMFIYIFYYISITILITEGAMGQMSAAWLKNAYITTQSPVRAGI